MSEKRFSSPFPRLFFGNGLAHEVSCAQKYGDQMARTLSTLNAFAPLEAEKEFRAKSFSVDINGLVLTANACSPVYVEVGSSSVVNLLVPLSGTCVTTHDRHAYHWRAGESAMYLPAVGRGGYSSTRSVLTIKFDLERLQETVRCMHGLEEQETLHLDRPRVLGLRQGDMSYLVPLRHVAAMIDDLASNSQILSTLNLDDTIYRWMAMLFVGNEKSVVPAEPDRKSVRRRQLDRVCDFALSRLENGITLTEMEREAGMSRRNLQYAFAEHFDCTPSDWIRKQRLAQARTRLLNAQPGDTVTSIALSLGFAKPSAFSRRYQEMYEELPSETLAMSGFRAAKGSL